MSAEASKRFLLAVVVLWCLLDGGLGVWVRQKDRSAESFLWTHQEQIDALDRLPEVLCFGNSMAGHAFRPHILEEFLDGAIVYNHAVSVGGLAIPPWALARQDDRGTWPRLVVWAVSPYEFSAKSDTLKLHVSRHLSPGDLSWVLRSGAARDELLKVLTLTGLSRAYRDDTRWKRRLFGQSLLQDMEFGPKGDLQFGETDPPHQPELIAKTRGFYRTTITNAFRASGSLERGFDLIRLVNESCRRHGARLVLVALPECRSYPTFYERGDYDWFWSRFASFVEEESLDLLDHRHLFPEDRFSDGIHLRDSGSLMYSRHLGGMLRDRMPR